MNLEDEIIRDSIILDNGKLLWPPPIRPQPAVEVKQPEKHEVAVIAPLSPFQQTLRKATGYTTGMLLVQFILQWYH